MIPHRWKQRPIPSPGMLPDGTGDNPAVNALYPAMPLGPGDHETLGLDILPDVDVGKLAPAMPLGPGDHETLGIGALPDVDGVDLEEKLFFDGFTDYATYAALPAAGVAEYGDYARVTTGTAKGLYRWIESLNGDNVQMWLPAQISMRITDYARDAAGHPAKFSCGIGGDNIASLTSRGWAMATRPNVAAVVSPNGFNFVDGGVGSDTIVRNDGGSWVADGFQIGQFFTVRTAEDAGNVGVFQATNVTASTLTLPTGSLAVSRNDDNTATFSVSSYFDVTDAIEFRSGYTAADSAIATPIFYPASPLSHQMAFVVFELDVTQLPGSADRKNQGCYSVVHGDDGANLSNYYTISFVIDDTLNRLGFARIVSPYETLGHGRVDFTPYQRIFTSVPIGYPHGGGGTREKLGYCKAWLADNGIETNNVAVRGYADATADRNSNGPFCYISMRNYDGTAPGAIARVREFHTFLLDG